MKRLALALCVLYLAPVSFAQTGYPLYGSFQSAPIDSVNLRNLNTVVSIPILGAPGRGGTNFSFSVAYNSLVWVPSGGAWLPTSYGGWTPNPSFGSVANSVTFTSAGCGKCYEGGDCQGEKDTTVYSGYVYTDPAGALHGFNVRVTEVYSSCTDTTTYTGTWSGYSGDGLYYINIGPTDGAPTQMVVWSTQTGTEMNLTDAPYSVTVTDRNGNQITETSSDGDATWVDTAGHTVLRQIPNGSNVEYHYYDTNGNDQKFVLKYQNYSVMTDFGCSGMLEYNSSGNLPQQSLPYELDLPNGLKYTFTYEGTPGHSGYITGRISEVALPTGGSYTYTYGGSNDGLSCSTGNIINLTRAISDGTNTATWQYVNALSGSNYATTLTAPQMPYDSATNQSVYTFNSSGQQITEQDYQGSSSSGTLLKTVNSTWASNGSPSAAVTVLPNNQQSEVATTYDNYGHLDQMVEYDWGNGAVGSKIRSTNLTYTTINAPVSFLALSDKQVLNSGGSVAFREDIAYDGSTPSCISGAVQHDDADFGCSYNTRGNATSITTYATPATQSGPLPKTVTYNTLGDTLTVSLDGTQQQNNFSSTTNYAYPDSVVTGGLTERYTYNSYTGQVVTDKDPNSATTSYAYDTMKRLTTITRADNVQLTTTYGDTAPPTLTNKTPIDSSGDAVQIVTAYDGLGRPLSTTTENASGTVFSEVQTVYDPASRVYKTSSPYTGSPSYWNVAQFDALSRRTSFTDAGAGTANFSYTGNDVYQSVGPAPSGENEKRRQSEYNGVGMLTSVCEVTSLSGSGTCSQTASATGYWTEYSYDVLGDLTGVTQNAQSGSQDQTRSFTYDGLGRMTSETNPETGTKYYFFDTDPGTRGGANCSSTYAGDLVKKVDAAGNVACYTYDALNRNLSVTYPYGPNSSNTPSKYFVYDSATVNNVTMADAEGRLAEAYTCSSSCTSKITDEGFSYTVLGQAQEVYQSTPHSGGYFWVTQSYWENGAPDLETNNLGNLPGITDGVDTIGRISSVSAGSGQNPVTGTSYNVANEVTALDLGSDDSDTFTFDSAMFRMTKYQFNVNGQSVVGNLTWNANGTLGSLAITDAFNAANTQTCTYGHDDLVRIASGNCGTVWSQTFTYDAFGNITKSGSNQFQPGYNYQTNQMSSGASYDSNGDVLSDSLHSYAWDVETRPTTIDTVTVTYDALGRMVEQAKSGSYTQIVYDALGHKLALMNGTSTVVKAFVSLPAGATAVYNASGLEYYRHPDQLGSSRFSSTPSRAMYNDLAYAPFGEQYAQSGSTGITDTSFAGMNEDTTSDLYDAQFREYGIQGRWPSPDPAGFAAANPANPQSWNRYAYVMNNPLASTDPMGLGQMGCLVQVRGRGPRAYCIDEPSGGGGGGGDDCGIDGGSGPCSLGGDGYASTPCPDNDCGFGSPGGEYQCDAANNCGYGMFYNIGLTMPVSSQDEMACVEQDLQETFGSNFNVTPANPDENGGHADFTFTMTDSSDDPSSLTSAQVNLLLLNQSTVTPTSSSRIDTPMGALHVEPNGPVGVGNGFSGTVHIDIMNPNDGLLGLIGHGLVDGLLGHVVQLFGGNIDQGC